MMALCPKATFRGSALEMFYRNTTLKKASFATVMLVPGSLPTASKQRTRRVPGGSAAAWALPPQTQLWTAASPAPAPTQPLQGSRQATSSPRLPGRAVGTPRATCHHVQSPIVPDRITSRTHDAAFFL